MAYSPSKFPADQLTFTAGATITAGQLVYISAADTVSPTSAATGAWVGVAAFDAASGSLVTVYVEGVHILAASGAIAAGANVIGAAAGAVATIASDASDGQNIVGLALTAAANSLVKVLLR
jgi:predicted RecA/RadA family phage recombinase